MLRVILLVTLNSKEPGLHRSSFIFQGFFPAFRMCKSKTPVLLLLSTREPHQFLRRCQTFLLLLLPENSSAVSFLTRLSANSKVRYCRLFFKCWHCFDLSCKPQSLLICDLKHALLDSS